ncbi:AlpA family phage regulatory protein [Sphingomonas sp. KRR8]|uniref:helix-turn-helix transcriptional regulator n=1 Tax=Sphingomonas sp. KRR8 TaxID=2942996 RepID=UPI0020222172|nr:AlpA family phage regulatory protein [Sphingomonas sp. KRR8]URD60698.1 AlpA family phage regulatory protein [Sphingomonas sp. KRR8]
MASVPKFITIKTVAGIANVSPSTARRYAKREDFPKPRYISPSRPMWIMDEVLAWFMNRPHTRIW